MIYLPMEQLLSRAENSTYKLVRMVAARALEIGEGGAKLIESPAIEKPATTAMREVMAGKLQTQGTAEQADTTDKEA